MWDLIVSVPGHCLSFYLLTVIGLITKHADCRIIFMLYPIRL